VYSICFCFAFVCSEKVPKSGVINDEAIELLVSEDLPMDHLYFFAPNYHGGNVTLIESLVPYINRLIMSIFGHSLRFLHLFFALCYAGACYLFFSPPLLLFSEKPVCAITDRFARRGIVCKFF
jgi:hypothetical protein